jgi:pyruvate/2-oxoglutarate dehydrogenase complex dihydrolipoamide dehydrogenase (E3) component
MTRSGYDVAILGTGSAAETLIGELDGSGWRIITFERALAGGECPFTACMPSKALLHDARIDRPWAQAARRRDAVVENGDDTSHADEIARRGVELVRAQASLAGPGRILADDREYEATHVVLATGSEPIVPSLDGDAEIWTSADLLTADVLPRRAVIVGEGVIGCELTQLLVDFGRAVTLVGMEERLFPDLPRPIGALLEQRFEQAGVELRLGRTASAARTATDGVEVELDDGSVVFGDRVVVAVGRRARLGGIGLESLGLATDQPLPVDACGRVDAPGSLWAVGDVAGRGQYTHLANHHARVVAANLRGGAEHIDDVALPRCVFTDPPIGSVGPTAAELDGDDDVVWATASVADVPRALTDELPDGCLVVAARRSTGTIVAAHGIGTHFDELIHALTVAIDGDVPVARLARGMQPFPTVGELLGVAFRGLADQLRNGAPVPETAVTK